MAAFAAVLAHASESLAGARADPVKAVHDYRKSLRRARSLLRMLRPQLSKRARRRIDVPLKEAHRSLSRDRDRSVLRDTWTDLSKATGLEIAGLAQTLESPPATLVLGTRTRRQFDDLVELLAERIEPDLSMRKLARGLTLTYRSARRELRRALTVPDPAHVHALRRRCKDLNYQLEALGSRVSKRRISRAREQLSVLAKSLGRVTDLYQLRAATGPMSGPIEVESLGHARAAINEAIELELADILAAAGDVFHDKPKVWTRSLDLGDCSEPRPDQVVVRIDGLSLAALARLEVGADDVVAPRQVEAEATEGDGGAVGELGLPLAGEVMGRPAPGVGGAAGSQRRQHLAQPRELIAPGEGVGVAAGDDPPGPARVEGGGDRGDLDAPVVVGAGGVEVKVHRGERGAAAPAELGQLGVLAGDLAAGDVQALEPGEPMEPRQLDHGVAKTLEDAAVIDHRQPRRRRIAKNAVAGAERAGDRTGAAAATDAIVFLDAEQPEAAAVAQRDVLGDQARQAKARHQVVAGRDHRGSATPKRLQSARTIARRLRSLISL